MVAALRARPSALLALAGALLASCAAAPAAPVASAAPPVAASARVGLPWNTDPFPSTYRRYPGAPTLIRNVTIIDGDGGRIDGRSLLFADGAIVALGRDVAAPAGAVIIDGAGKWVTPGIIDVHAHIGAMSSPNTASLADGNDITNPVTPGLWVEHSVWPQDPNFERVLTKGGVTTMQILPGSANLFGGRSVVVKNVPAATVQAMKFPGAPYGLKMACGENPKRFYGGVGRMPSTRMGNMAVDRENWAKATEYKRRWERYLATGGEPPARDLAMDTLAGVLDGKILVQNHCYRAEDMGHVIDMAKEFGYHVSVFHHALEAYKIAALLEQNDICVAAFADQFGFKMEANDGTDANIALLAKAGTCVMIHSDEHNAARRLNQEVAKAVATGRRMGIDIPEAEAWKFLSSNPAKGLGISDRTGSLKPGKMADVVLWNGDPFSVYTRPEKVWIDGALLFDAMDPARRPVSDFEIGQPHAGVVK
ncbi:amidohydrolase [Sphingopyxis fribergensis]